MQASDNLNGLKQTVLEYFNIENNEDDVFGENKKGNKTSVRIRKLIFLLGRDHFKYNTRELASHFNVAISTVRNSIVTLEAEMISDKNLVRYYKDILLLLTTRTRSRNKVEEIIFNEVSRFIPSANQTVANRIATFSYIQIMKLLT
jgi:hypothetical protein